MGGQGMSKDYDIEVDKLYKRIDELEAKVKELEAENARLVASIKPSEYHSVLGSEFIRFLKWEGEDNE